VDVELAIRTVGNYIDRVQVVADQLRKIGIRGTIKTWEGAAGFAAYARGEFQIVGTQDTATYVDDPSNMFGILYVEGAGRNWQKWVDPEINKWADDALRETNHAKRVAIYHRMQRKLLTGDNAVPIVGWIEGWYFRDKRMQNYKPANTIYDNSTFMKVWLDR
jgi:ABC-type transport system substrate-binding protein